MNNDEWIDEYGVIYSADKKRLIYCSNRELKEYSIIPECEVILESAFMGCFRLTNIIIPESVNSIGDSAFRCCRELKSLIIPNSVTTIGHFAFAGCNELTSVSIGNSVTFIGEHAFCNCFNLTNINIPESVNTILMGAFDGCSNLTDYNVLKKVHLYNENNKRNYDNLISLCINAFFVLSFVIALFFMEKEARKNGNTIFFNFDEIVYTCKKIINR